MAQTEDTFQNNNQERKPVGRQISMNCKEFFRMYPDVRLKVQRKAFNTNTESEQSLILRSLTIKKTT